MNKEQLIAKGANLVAPCLAVIPFIGLIITALYAAGVNLRPGAVGSVYFISLISLLLMVPVLARLELAPFIALGSVVVGWIGIWIIQMLALWRHAAQLGIRVEDYGGGAGMGGLVIFLAAAAGVSLWQRSSFTRKWSSTFFIEWARRGLFSYFREDDEGGPRRALLAVGLLAAAFALGALFMPDADPRVEVSTIARILGPAVIFSLGSAGLGLLFKSVQIPDDGEAPPAEEPPASGSDHK